MHTLPNFDEMINMDGAVQSGASALSTVSGNNHKDIIDTEYNLKLSFFFWQENYSSDSTKLHLDLYTT